MGVFKWAPLDMNKFPPVPGDTVWVCGRMRYEWEKEWTYFVDVARMDADGNLWLWNDWHEGQQYYEIKYWKPIDQPDPVPEGEW